MGLLSISFQKLKNVIFFCWNGKSETIFSIVHLSISFNFELENYYSMAFFKEFYIYMYVYLNKVELYFIKKKTNKVKINW